MASPSTDGVKCVITGAGGFVGQALAARLSSDPTISQLILADVNEPPIPPKSTSNKITSHAADLTVLEDVQSLLDSSIHTIFLLHGIMSSQAESDLDLGLKVNIDSIRLVLDHLRATNPNAKVVFASSTAVYGPPTRSDVAMSEEVAPNPQSSYGAQKHIAETLINDYSRRSLVDGRVVRLPTVTVRPGKPTGAASSFASGIFREPLNGQQANLPVSTDVKLWICSPRTVVQNLIHAMNLPLEALQGKSRILNLPGITLSVDAMIQALENVGGRQAVALIEEKHDKTTQKIVDGWPTVLDTSEADRLGFVRDSSFEKILKEYVEDYTEINV